MSRELSRRTVLKGVMAGGVASALGSPAAARQATPEATPAEAASSGPITIYQAKKIVTQYDIVPEAEYVAVRDGSILGAGTLDDLSGWGDYTLDDTFKDLVIIPGLIEAHNHVFEGVAAFLPYVGYYDRPAIDGSVLKGITSYEALIAYLKEEDAKLTDPTTPLLAFQFDPIYFWGQDAFTKTTLDQVSTTRQVAVWYASEHTLMLNTAALTANKITAAATDPGVVKGADGEPTGALNSPSAISLAPSLYTILAGLATDAKTIKAMGEFGHNAGCVLVTDMASELLASEEGLKTWSETVNAPDYPVRVCTYLQVALPGPGINPDTIADKVLDLRESSGTEKLHISGVKLVLDGSIQEFTATLLWPGYYKGPNDQPGQLMTEDEVISWLKPLQAAGVQVCAHCNGDATVDLFLDAVSTVDRAAPASGLRHTVQHSQLTTHAQYARMAELGLCANIFANHLWYWGDQHFEITVGPERASGMEASATALANGVPFSLHTDASVTPLGCLHSMWCAVNRVTPKGRVLGESQKLTAAQALHAVTLGSAHLLHLDDVMGSIEPGKWADFTILAESPLDVDPMKIKDIAVWGTVLGGVKQPGAGAATITG